MNLDRFSISRIALAVVVAFVTNVVEGDETEFKPPKMQLPDGFMVEVVAAPPLVKYPMMGCLDDRGRMFIAETHGQNLDKAGLLKHKHRFIRMIEDTDGDGRFDKSTIFADGLVMPEGALWYRGSLYVLSSPYLWRFADTDGDGVADVREKLVGQMEFNGKANQHGAYLGPCGRLYFSGGTFGYNLVGSDGKSAYPVGKANAAGVFSCSLDGSNVEIFGTGGINPVEVVFSPEGELFTTCPIIDNIDGRHDALIHWVRGATIGTTDFRPPPLAQTGYRLPPLSRWGQVAPSGLMRIRSSSGLGESFQGRLISTHFNTRTVMSTRIERHGSTYRSFDEPLLTSPNPDFHPTDIMEDADGSLLLIDTGGWFNISCPFSKTAKPEIPGAIYRIRRVGLKSPVDPRGEELNWKDPTMRNLWDRLDDPRPVVRDRAIAEFHELGSKASGFLLKRYRYESQNTDSSSAQTRRNAVWAASRIGSVQCRKLIQHALSDSDHTVQQAAARSAGVLRDANSAKSLQLILRNKDLPWSLRRAAATSLGQVGNPGSVSSLLASSAGGGDDFFQHAVVYALVEIGDFVEVSKGLTVRNPQVQHAAIVAMDRIAHSRIKKSHVIPLLETDDARLRQTVIKLISERKGWNDEIIGLLKQFVSKASADSNEQASIRGALIQYAKDERVQRIVAETLVARDRSLARSVVLQGMARMPSWPKAWVEPLEQLMSDAKQPHMVNEVVSVVIASGTDQLDASLRSLAVNKSRNKDARVLAWVYLCSREIPVPNEAVDLLTKRAIAGEPLMRIEASRALASAKLTLDQLKTVAQVIAEAGPVELVTLLSTFDRTSVANREIGLALVKSLEASPGKTSLSRKQVQRLLERFPESVQAESKALLARLKASDSNRAGQLDAITSKLVEGNAERGRKLFYSNQVACSACHRVAGDGGTIGPDLSRIGGIRNRRDLLEAIVFPSATIVNNYETWSAATSNGRVHTGVIQRSTPKTIVLRNTQRMEIELNRDSIERLVRQPKSIMPVGLDKTLTSRELSDLLAFLQSLRTKQ